MFTLPRDLHPAVNLIVLICLFFLGTFVILIPAFIIAIPIWGGDVFHLNLQDPETPVSFQRYMQTASQIGGFLLPALFYAKITFENRNEYFKFSFPKGTFKLSVFSILAVLFVIPFLDYLANWNLALHFPDSMQDYEAYWRDKEDAANSFFKILFPDASTSTLFINLFVIAVVPAICEEFFFRGVLQQIFKKVFPNNVHLAIFVTAIIFTTIHFQLFSFIPRLLLGLLFGYFFEYSKTIIVPVVVHFINNGLVVYFYFLYKRGYTFFSPDKITYPGPEYVWIVGSILLSAFFLYMFFRLCKAIRNKNTFV